MSCPTANDCTGVGSFADANGNGEALVEHWNGANWQLQTAPNPAGAAASVLNGVACTSGHDAGDRTNGAASVCTAVGAWSA